MFLISYIGDQAIVVNVLLKQSYLLVKMVSVEYKHVIYIRGKREQMKNNCPDIRLDMNGSHRIH